MMYSHRHGLVLGFHGTDSTVVDKIVNHKDAFKPSEREYDWLGHGYYYWENDHNRAFDWAKTSARDGRGAVQTPAVLGSVLSLGRCLDLMSMDFSRILRDAYHYLAGNRAAMGLPLPENRETPSGKKLHNLDCAVIEVAHTLANRIEPNYFDSVRAPFMEGDPIYANASFKELTHIQICIRNPNCIKGFFIPTNHDKNWRTL